MTIFKKNNYFLFAVLFIAFIIYSCKDENQSPIKFKGKISLTLQADASVTIGQERAAAVNTDSFKVIIYNASGTVVKTFEKYTDVPQEIELDTGSYYVVAHSNNEAAASFENAYYYGQSVVFQVSPKQVVSVTVTCELYNFFVTVKYTANVTGNCNDWSTQVWNDEDTLEFVKGETRSGYFKVAPVSILARLTYTKSDSSTGTINITGSINDPHRKTHYIITIDAQFNGSVNSKPIEINVDESSEIVNLVFTNYQANLNVGLVAYYPFNGNANDQSGNNNNGTVHGATLTNDRSGNPNSAYLFDGVDDYIEIPHSESLNLTQQISISFWAKFETSGPYYYPYHIIEKHDCWGLMQREINIHWWVDNSEGVAITTWSNNLEYNKFYHFVMTYDGSKLNIYVDGELNSSTSGIGLIRTNTNNIYIGEYPLGGDYYFDGILDDFRIYNRALTEQEISALYNE